MRPTLTLLEPLLVDRVIDEAFAVLERTGVRLRDPRAIRLLAAQGLVTDAATQRLKFPRRIVEQALSSAPHSITLFDRDGRPAAVLEGDNVHFVPASSALHILDRRTQEIREPDSADFVEYVRLAGGLRHLAYLSTAFVPRDIPQTIADAWRLYLVLAHSRSPVVSGAFTATGVPRMAELMAAFRSDRAELAQRPMAIFTCCPGTPLRWGEDSVANLIDCALWGIPVEIVPVLLLGMIAPVTTLGALVLHTAEVLSGITIAEVVRPGAPVIFGGAPAAFHMRLMTNPMSAVEALQLNCACAQVAKRLRLPCQAYMALSDAKANDPQAGMETGVGAFLAASAGINSVSGPGVLDYVNCFSLEKLVFDDEIAGHALHFVRPVEVRGDLPAAELIEELVRSERLLTAAHTRRHWRQELYLPGPTVDRSNWNQWAEQGSRDWRARANAVIDQTLAGSVVPPLEAALDAELRRILSGSSERDLPELPGLAQLQRG